MLAGIATGRSARALASCFLVLSVCGLVASSGVAEEKKKSKEYALPPASAAGGAKGASKGVGGGILVNATTIDGALEQTDETLPNDGTFFDYWTFDGKEGDLVAVRMTASEFVPCMALFLKATIPMQLGGQCEPATAVLTLPKTGTYIVAANAMGPGDVGAYKIRLDVLPPM